MPTNIDTQEQANQKWNPEATVENPEERAPQVVEAAPPTVDMSPELEEALTHLTDPATEGGATDADQSEKVADQISREMHGASGPGELLERQGR